MVGAARHARSRTGLRPVKKVLGIHGNFHNILAGGHQQFVDLSRADSPDVIERARLVRTIEELWRPIRVPVQRLVLEVVVVCEAETQALLVSQVHVNCSRVFPLVESVQFGSKPVAAANQCVGNRP